MQRQNVLSLAGIPLSWDMAYVGLKNHWLSVTDVIENIHSSELQALTVEEIAGLYSKSESSPGKLLAYVMRFTHNTDAAISTRIWAYAFLTATVKSETSVKEKLDEAASLWAMFDYVEQWKEFIYYLPVSNNESLGEEFLYKKLIEFLQEESDNLQLWRRHSAS